ncbi:N-acetyl-gamma-glutamyl-phosphate reductase [Sneathiella sp. P13V-1]|uniref:N-acetyl-gamma-glutamyl-phosphate reductase n=1 Tax=Sneathiella sp. P13V-1 TaxID=2697366 RepID=UPI00187B5283|nr:N-acetyl-gamma-glutamyl-phosphate reductase [Sneathiella sp. P13V-1]MBE7636958.1 N-acetyl-gamma-glutamyl-phosphate reductase [Sneathiella sp. P13V-1]
MEKQNKVIKAGILGASGYTGAEAMRLLLRHPNVELTLLTADRKAGQSVEEVYPHLGGYGLPDMVSVEDADWSSVDVVFCGLPHGTTQEIIATLPKEVKVVDLSADFRLRNPETYAEWYGHAHQALDLQKEAVYGLTEFYREDVKEARLVACPGCYPTATLIALLPLVRAGLVDPKDLVIDAKSGITGAGRGLKQNTLFSEAGEGLSPYSVSKHRHAPEIEQEVAAFAGLKADDVRVNFVPHLIPMSRGELVTCHVKLTDGKTVQDIRDEYSALFKDEPFVRLLDGSAIPQTQMVRGSNHCVVNVFEDRIPGRATVIAAIDNLVKGSSGQAIQNMNLMFGFGETLGLEQVALFP